MCFTEMFDFTAKQSPASFPLIFFLSITFAWSIAWLFRWRKMLRSLTCLDVIFFVKEVRFSRAVSFPCWICLSLCLRFACGLWLVACDVIGYLLFRLGI